MVKADATEEWPDDEVEDITVVRELDMVCKSSMSHYAIEAIAELKAEQGRLAAEHNDPVLLELEELYLGKVLRDEDERGKPHYEVVAISYDERSGGKYWEATVAPVSLSAEGVWATPRSCYIVEGGEEMIDPRMLEGYVLVDLTEPEKRPADIVYVERPGDVAKMIALHQERELLRLPS
jgi:hypothetical protein